MFNFLKKKPVKLYWWRYEHSPHGNFGDEISKLIIERLFHKAVTWSPPDECEVIGAGSLMQDMVSLVGSNKPYIWGTGIIEEGSLRIPAEKFRLLGVRGESTRARIDGETSEIFLGDTGLLASRAIPKPKNKYKVGIIPHYVDMQSDFISTLVEKFGKDIYVIDATDSCEKVIEEIASCTVILSSSLHGLIVADSYGIPNIHVPISEKVRGGNYKFIDYFSAFKDRVYSSLPTSRISSLETTDEIVAIVSENYVAPTDIKNIQNAMMKAFPF